MYGVCQDVVVFVEKPNARLFCLLCKNVFKEPVIVSCGVRVVHCYIVFVYDIFSINLLNSIAPRQFTPTPDPPQENMAIDNDNDFIKYCSLQTK